MVAMISSAKLWIKLMSIMNKPAQPASLTPQNTKSNKVLANRPDEISLKDSANRKSFIDRLSKDYPNFTLRPGPQEHWSPKTNTITYNPHEPLNLMRHGLLHELSHALLGHSDYQSDFELLKLEASAWELAAKIGKKYNVSISQNHIQNCLDTYRDWLHKRSACPKCGMRVPQKDPSHYHCFNCQNSWRVSASRFVRPYRLSTKT